MSRYTIRRFMTLGPHSITSRQTLAEAHQTMRERGVRHLPVVDDGKLVGVVSQRDLYLLETLRGVDAGPRAGRGGDELRALRRRRPTPRSRRWPRPWHPTSTARPWSSSKRRVDRHLHDHRRAAGARDPAAREPERDAERIRHRLSSRARDASRRGRGASGANGNRLISGSSGSARHVKRIASRQRGAGERCHLMSRIDSEATVPPPQPERTRCAVPSRHPRMATAFLPDDEIPEGLLAEKRRPGARRGRGRARPDRRGQLRNLHLLRRPARAAAPPCHPRGTLLPRVQWPPARRRLSLRW